MATYAHAFPALSYGDHCCGLFDSPEEQAEMSAVFLALGLDRGERCVFVGAEDAVARVEAKLASAGLEPARRAAEGRLTMTSARDFLRDGHWSTEKMLGFLESAYDGALAVGFPGLRATGDVSWQVGPDRDFEAIPRYEALLDRFFSGKRMVGLCQYPRASCPPPVLEGVLDTHRIAVVGGGVFPNTNYVPPDILLELDPAARELKRAQWKASQLGGGSAAERGPKILVVDDDPDYQTVLSVRLQVRGYRVIPAVDGDDALRLFELEKPDLVLLDIRMPSLDGIEVLREMREQGPDAKIIVVSGHVSQTQAQLAMQEGAADFFTKPVDLKALEDAIAVQLIC